MLVIEQLLQVGHGDAGLDVEQDLPLLAPCLR
jgi:hypothetical protein